MVEAITRRALLAASAAFAVGAAPQAGAQTYPNKPIKMIVPFPPGGPIDVSARLVAQLLTASLGQSVIIENRPGAGATIGVKAAAIAEPDGYTLLYRLVRLARGQPGALRQARLRPGQDRSRAVATVALLPHVFVVSPSLPPKTVAEFVAYAKANPGKLNYGAGLGTPPHLLSTLFKTKAGIDVAYVPYKGSAQSVTDLLGGQTHFTIDGTAWALSAHRRKQGPSARDRADGALARPARRADARRNRLPGYRRRRMDRRGRAGRHAAADRRQTQRRDQRGPEIGEKRRPRSRA